MGFLCNIRADKKNVVQSELIQQEFLRDIGLDVVYNLKPEVKFCSEVFLSPSFYVSGTSKLYTGTTANITGCTTGDTAIYNLNHTPNFNINFILTGDTSFTGYTGSFCYRVYSDNYFSEFNTGVLNKGSELINECISFSSITSTTITKQFIEGSLPKNWSQYLIRPYYKFESKSCNKNNSYDSWDYVEQFNKFNNEIDYLFTTIIDPPTPILSGPENSLSADYNLITDKLLINGISTTRGSQSINNSLNYFLLSNSPPNGQIMLVLNGVQLTEGYDYRLISRNYGEPPVVEILNNVIKPTDWLIATYIAGTPSSLATNLGIYFIDTIVVSSFTNTTTSAYRVVGDNTLNYNPVTNKYEFFTTNPINPDFSILVTVNGIQMAQNYQYFLSDSFDGRIIFEGSTTVLNIGDVVSVLAVSKTGAQIGNDYGSLEENSFDARWNVTPEFTNQDVTGRFIVKVYDNDTNVLTNQYFVDYINGQSSYSYKIDNLSLNVNYRFEIIFETTYTSLLNNKIITCSSSEGFFDTTSLYLNNKY
jgi:hypothetical protein